MIEIFDVLKADLAGTQFAGAHHLVKYSGVRIGGVSTLPTLVGTSSKQINWASEIRRQAVVNLTERISNLVSAPAPMTKAEGELLIGKACKMVETVAKKLDTRTSASWWIENRAAFTVSKVYDTILYS